MVNKFNLKYDNVSNTPVHYGTMDTGLASGGSIEAPGFTNVGASFKGGAAGGADLATVESAKPIAEAIVDKEDKDITADVSEIDAIEEIETVEGKGASGVEDMISMGGSAGGASSAMGGMGAMFSDRRLKHDIEFLRYSPSGLKIYKFKYNNIKFGEGIFEGVMSDEIPQNAVIKQKDGYDRVDYSKLDVEFKQI